MRGSGGESGHAGETGKGLGVGGAGVFGEAVLAAVLRFAVLAAVLRVVVLDVFLRLAVLAADFFGEAGAVEVGLCSMRLSFR